MAMEVESASLCNVVIKYLLDQQYLLTAFELMHELIEDGHSDRATRLQQIFSDPELYPPDEILRLQNLQVANPQRVVEERDAAEKKATILEYELRLAKDDINRLQEKLERHIGAVSNPYSNVDGNEPFELNKDGLSSATKSKLEAAVSPLIDPLHESERRVLDRAVKEYLLAAGYKLTAMTFYEEVDQDLDAPQADSMQVPNALRRYYQQFLTASPEEMEEKKVLQEERKKLFHENELLVKSKDSLEQEILFLKKSIETSLKDTKEKEKKISDLKQSMDILLKDLNGHRMEITSLKLELEFLKAGQINNGFSREDNQLSTAQEGIDISKVEVDSPLDAAVKAVKDTYEKEEKTQPCKVSVARDIQNDLTGSHISELDHSTKETVNEVEMPIAVNEYKDIKVMAYENYSIDHEGDRDTVVDTSILQKHEIETVEILADALPKIVPYVLINHREELLPLMMCAIERHPESSVRDLLTHTLFNLIKRPDENQRRIIMDACVSLSKCIGEERTELELLPQCWEQINHKYEERRLLVAQSCGQLAQFVKPEMRISLILSIIQQLMEDPAAVVREAASHNLAILLPWIPSMDKYSKVEDLMFRLILDPSGIVVETTLKELVPAVLLWGKEGNQPLSQLLRVLFSHILGSAQHCPPASGVEGSLDARLRVLGERERWNLDVLLRLLIDLLPEVAKLVRATCPYQMNFEEVGTSSEEKEESFFSESLIRRHLTVQNEWPAFDWLHVDCLPMLLQLALMLSSTEDSLRSRLTKVLVGINEQFGSHYLSIIIKPIFFTAAGDTTELPKFPDILFARVEALKPKTDIDERLATLCILPLLLTGVLGEPSMREQLPIYLRSLFFKQASKHGAISPAHTPEFVNAMRFLCTFEQHHAAIISVLWELVVNSNADLKISAATIMKILVPYVDAKVATHDILPALVTLGSDPNLLVKCSSIEAFGAVAQHFKENLITDKIRVQMDAFLEDGSHEAIVTVIRTLAIAVPLMSSNLKDFLLQKLLLLTGATSVGTNIMRRREKVDAFCEAIRALDATDLSVTNVKELLLPVIQNLLKDLDSLDPAHKEALELIVKERSSGRLDMITKAMGTHLSFTGVSNLFSENVFHAKKETLDTVGEPHSPSPPQAPVQEETRLFNRFMRGNFGDMIRGKNQNQ